MADYDSTVGVKLQDDFSSLINGLKNVEALVLSLQRKIQSLYSTSSKLQSVFKGLNATNLSSNVEKAQALLANNAKKMQSRYSSLATMLKKSAGSATLSTDKGYSSLAGLNDINGTKLRQIIAYQQNISGLGKTLDEVGIKSEKNSTKFWRFFDLNKLYFYSNYFKQVFRSIGSVIQSSLDFTETENYFARAMGNMYDEAMKFQNKLSNMFGTAMGTTMNAQAIYKNMIGNLGGISDELSYKLSETVTKMTLDFSSLYNVDFEDASKKFQSALSKQVRPIRSTSGYDITQNVLAQTAENIGMSKALSDASELEKRLLVIITLMDQMRRSGAMNDFSRTIEQPANQLRVLKEQIAEVGRWLGSVFYGILGSILPYINGFVMAIKEVVRWLALLIGYEIPNSSGDTGTILDSYGDLGAIEDVNDSIGDTGSALDDANKKAKEFQKTTSGFDELNIIKKPTESASSGGTGGGAGGGLGTIDPSILNALDRYKYMFEDIRMKAMDIRDAILAWGENAKKAINENIFQLLQVSWDKYGESVLMNFTQGFANLKILALDFIDTLSSNWKPNFQAISDLFFSLLDTASLVFNTISDFMLDVWNKGGKDLYNSINELGRSFVRLATSINDEFIKPVIKWFKNNLSDGISTAIGNCMKIVSGLVDLLADFVNFLAQKGNPTLKVFVGIWATWKATKVISDVNKLTSAIKLVNPVVGGFATQAILADSKVGILSKTITKLTQFFKLLVTDGFSKAISVFPSLNNVWSTAVNFVNKYASSLGGALTKMSNLTNGIPLLSSGLGKIGTVLSSASFGPWALGIGVATTAIVGLVSYLGNLETEAEKADKRLQEFNEKRNKELEDFRENTKQNIETGLEETLMLERNIERLKELIDENGKLVGSKDELKSVVKQINDVAPDTIKWINDETIAIDGGISSLDKYVEKKKAQIIVDAELEASAKAIIEIRKLESENAEKLAKKEEYLSKIKNEQAIRDTYNFETATEEERIRYLQTFENIDNYETKIRELNNEVGINTDSINGYKDEMAQADADAMALMSENANGYSLVIDNMSSLVSASYETMQTNTASERNTMLEKEKSYLDELSDANVRAAKGITDEQYAYLQQQYENHKIWNGEIANAERIKNYDLLDLQADLAKNTDEKTIKMLYDVWKNYKDYGYSSGNEFVSKLQEEMAKNDGILNEASLIALGIKSEIEGQSYEAKVKTNYDETSLYNTKEAIKRGIANIGFGFSGSSSGSGGRINLVPYASGGFPNVGEIFMARENGINEMVGRMGSRSVVANNDQIVDGIESGVFNAVVRALQMTGGMNRNNPNYIENVIKIGEDIIQKQIVKANEKKILRTGKPLFSTE